MRSDIIAADLPSRRFEPRIYGVGAWTDYIHFAYDLLALLRPGLFVELGADRGESYFAFCQSAAENETGTRCFAVDTWQGDAQAGAYDETTFALVAAHNRAHYEDFSTLIRSSFDAALDQFPDAGIDLLHLDGLHSEDAVRHDLAGWLPKLRPGGLLLLHDVAVRSRGFGVWKVWAELQTRGRAYTFDSGPGLGLWQKSPNESLPEPSEKFLAGAEQERATLREYYRDRTAQLHEQISRDWRDGTVRDQPFLQQTIIQVFYTSDGVHREEDSVQARVGHSGWKNLSIELPVGIGAAPLRIDFVSPWTTIDMAALRLTSPTQTYFEAASPEAFDKLVLAGDVERLPHPDGLRLKITGIDPQLYLPAITAGQEKLTLEMRLQIHPNH